MSSSKVENVILQKCIDRKCTNNIILVQSKKAILQLTFYCRSAYSTCILLKKITILWRYTSYDLGLDWSGVAGILFNKRSVRICTIVPIFAILVPVSLILEVWVHIRNLQHHKSSTFNSFVSMKKYYIATLLFMVSWKGSVRKIAPNRECLLVLYT